MAKKPPQFFNEPPDKHTTNARPTTNRAVYTLPYKDADGKPILILVDCAEGRGNTPRNAATYQDLHLYLDKEIEKVGYMAQSVLETLKKLSPGALEIEFGIELGGEAGIPMITKTAAKANFKVTLKWSRNQKKEEEE